MDPIQMVKCQLSSKKAGDVGDVRFVPLEIYRLWRFLMERVHNLNVSDPVVSGWAAVGSKEFAEPADPADVVIEVRFDYQESGGVIRPVTRYFPEKDFQLIYSYFSKHFQQERMLDGVHRMRGVYLSADAKPYVEDE